MSTNKRSSSGIRTFVVNGGNKETSKNFKPAFMSILEVIGHLNTNTETGLSFQTAQKRRKKLGLNLLYPEFKRTFASSFVDHLKAVVTVLLALSLFVYYTFYREFNYLLCAVLVTASILSSSPTFTL